MGTQISSVFPNGDIHDSETQYQFLYSIDSQNPKNAQPVSSDLLDFNRQTNNFVLFTQGQMDFVHYWQCQNIFVAAFAAPKCPIPERSYHHHSFKGLSFITINCNENCYQIMNHFMDHVKSSITRTEFLNKVISEINSQNVKDLHGNKLKDAFNEAPQIRRASPSTQKRGEYNYATSSLAPSLASIKKSFKSKQSNENTSIEAPTKKKVSIQLPTLEDSHLPNTLEMITYDSVNISTSFTTTDKNVSDYDDTNEEEEINNSKTRNLNSKRKLKNVPLKNNMLLESDDNGSEHEMLSEYSEEENNNNNEQVLSKQKQIRAKNKILMQNKETGSVQSKLDNANLSFTNKSDAAKSVTLLKKSNQKRKKIAKKSKKPTKNRKRSKKNGNSDKTTDEGTPRSSNPKNAEGSQPQNIQQIDKSSHSQSLAIQKDAIVNISPNQYKNTSKIENNQSSNHQINNDLGNNSFNGNNNLNDTNNYNDKYNSNTNNTISNNINGFVANMLSNKNDNINFPSNNLYDPKGNDKPNSLVKNRNRYNPNINQTNRLNNNDSKFRCNELNNKENQRSLTNTQKPNIDNISYSEEEDDEEIVKINLKFTNTQDNYNVFFNKRSQNYSSQELENEEQTKSDENEIKKVNKYDTRNIDSNLNSDPHQSPTFQISESTRISLPKGSKGPAQISNPIAYSRLPEDNSLIDKCDKQNLRFTLSNPYEVCRTGDNNLTNSSKMQVAHLVEISKFDKPKPKIEIGHIVDISLPETESSTKKKKTEKENTQQQLQERSQKYPKQNLLDRQNDGHYNDEQNSDYDYEYFTVVDEKRNQQLPPLPPNEPLVAILSKHPLTKQRRRRRHHHHRRNKQIESGDYDDYQNDDDSTGKKHRRRKHHHHYNNDDSNQRHRSPEHHHHSHHHRSQSRRTRKNNNNDYYEYDDNDDIGIQRSRNASNKDSPKNERIDTNFQQTANKSTQLSIKSTRTVATSTSFFDKDSKLSQTKESILSRQKEKGSQIDFKQEKETKSTNTNFSDNDKIKINNKNQHKKGELAQSSNNDDIIYIPKSSISNKQPPFEKDQKVSNNLPTQNSNDIIQSKLKQKVPSEQQNKKYNKNNNEYDDYNYDENDYENENSQKDQPNSTKKIENTIDSSGWSAALNTISGIENDRATTPNKVTSRFIKNNNASTNSTISHIDDSIDGSLIQKIRPNDQIPPSSQQQDKQQHILQRTRIFPLPENNEDSLSEEDEEELDENQSSNNNIDNNVLYEEEESVLTGTINDDDEFVVKNRSSRTQSSSSRGSQSSAAKRMEVQIKKIENIDPITSKSSEVSQFDIFNSDKENKNNSSSSFAKKRQNKQICLKKFDHHNKPDSDKFNEFSGSTGTTSSDIGDLENVAKRNIINDSSSSSSRNQRKKNSSGFSSEFEPKKKECDFPSNAFEAFSTDSSQNYPSFNEISEKIQQASLVSYDSLKT